MTTQNTLRSDVAKLGFGLNLMINHRLSVDEVVERMKDITFEVPEREWVSYAELKARRPNTNTEIDQLCAVYALEAGVLDNYQADFVAEMSYLQKKRAAQANEQAAPFFGEMRVCASARAGGGRGRNPGGGGSFSRG